MTLAPAEQREPAPWPYPLYRLTLAVAAATRPEDIFEAALTSLEESLGVQRASILLFDGAGVMRFRAWRNLSDGYRRAVDGHSPWSPHTTDAEPVLVEDVHDDAELASLRAVFEEEGIRSLAFVPLRIGTKLLGKFMLYYTEPHGFTEEELATARTIAAHVAFAIDQQAHRESERRYQELLRTLGVAVYSTDSAGLITFYNEEAALLWGRRPELGVDAWSGAWHLSTPDGERIADDGCPMAIAVREGRAVRGVQLVAERPDGSRVHFVPYPTPIFDDTGRLTGAVNVLVDITDLKNAEAAVAAKEASLVAALAEKVDLLRARDDTIRQHERTQAHLASLIEASQTLMTTRERQGAVLPILRIASQLLGADAFAMWRLRDGHDEWEISLSQGLSDRYIASSTLRPQSPSERPLPTLVVEDVLAETRLETRASAYAEEGIRSLFICPLQTPEETLGTVVFYYRSPHAFSELEVRVGVALANLAAASLTAARLFEANERAREALMRANTELSATADELRVANAAKDEFLGLVSHELKTPLTTVRGNAEILLRAFERLDAESRTGALTDILAESERLHRIIENLLLLARTERGDPSDLEPVLAWPIVRKVVERHRRRHPERRFDIVGPGQGSPILCSEACIEQVLDNFLSNAEKYSPAPQAITVAIRRDANEVAVDVIDAGDGIDTGDTERLFEPFYRSERSRGRAEGLGIGLAVCKRLVEAYGGRIWARERDGGGAVFGFCFPVLDEAGVAE